MYTGIESQTVSLHRCSDDLENGCVEMLQVDASNIKGGKRNCFYLIAFKVINLIQLTILICAVISRVM